MCHLQGHIEIESHGFTVIADGEYHEYRLPLGDHEEWKGTITAFRLDPTQIAEGEVRVDEIKGE